jgi:hypothetical protein
VATATVVRRAGIEGTFSQEVLKPTGCARPAAGPGEDPPARTCHCGFDERWSDDQLAKRRTYHCYLMLSIGGSGSSVLILPFQQTNQQYRLRTQPTSDL